MINQHLCFGLPYFVSGKEKSERRKRARDCYEVDFVQVSCNLVLWVSRLPALLGRWETLGMRWGILVSAFSKKATSFICFSNFYFWSSNMLTPLTAEDKRTWERGYASKITSEPFSCFPEAAISDIFCCFVLLISVLSSPSWALGVLQYFFPACSRLHVINKGSPLGIKRLSTRWYRSDCQILFIWTAHKAEKNLLK